MRIEFSYRLPFALMLHWSLWGVLLSGTISSLLFEHGSEIFREHLTTLIVCLMVLPVIGGMLTPERPAYTVLVFAIGSVPPLNDIPPIPIGLWPFFPFLLAREEFRPIDWHEVITALPSLVAIPAVAVTLMSVVYLPLVYLGWSIRCSRFKAVISAKGT